MKSIFVALVVFLVCIGCSKSNSSPSIVGEWHLEEAGGKASALTILSDGTGDFSAQGERSLEIKWERVKDKFEATLRENKTT